MTTRTYTSPQTFKQALEQRLRTASKSGVDSYWCLIASWPALSPSSGMQSCSREDWSWNFASSALAQPRYRPAPDWFIGRRIGAASGSRAEGPRRLHGL